MDTRIAEFLWPKGNESSVPYRLREPGRNLVTAADLARHSLAKRMSSLALQRDILHILAPAAPGLHKDDLM